MSESNCGGARRIDDEAVLDAVAEGHPGGDYHKVVTSEVAERLDCHHSTALRRLKQLHEAGEIEGNQKSPGWFWWLPKEGSNDE